MEDGGGGTPFQINNVFDDKTSSNRMKVIHRKNNIFKNDFHQVPKVPILIVGPQSSFFVKNGSKVPFLGFENLNFEFLELIFLEPKFVKK